SEVFSTAEDNQPSVEVHVLQGEAETVYSPGARTLGRFQLVGIPAAPRGMPQIEVTFDIYANGIVHVAAKDLGTGKAQAMTMTGRRALPAEVVERMIGDANIDVVVVASSQKVVASSQKDVRAAREDLQAELIMRLFKSAWGAGKKALRARRSAYEESRRSAYEEDRKSVVEGKGRSSGA